MDFPAIEGLRVECHSGRVPSLGTDDADLPSKLHPWDGEDGAGVGAGQCEDVFFPMVQEPKHTSRREGESGQHEQAESMRDENTWVGGSRRPCSASQASHLNRALDSLPVCCCLYHVEL